jgi:hypothetical protein
MKRYGLIGLPDLALNPLLSLGEHVELPGDPKNDFVLDEVTVLPVHIDQTPGPWEAKAIRPAEIAGLPSA